jgi:hypothetical protein
MDTRNPVPLAEPLETPLPPEAFRAFRGGGILLAGAFVAGLLVHPDKNHSGELCLIWISFAFLVFPTGAYLGWFLPQWVAHRGWATTGVIGVIAGILAGLFLATACWAVANHHDLIQWFMARPGPGYESYIYSIKAGLRKNAWLALAHVAPFSIVWITGWSMWVKAVSQHPSSLNPSTRVRLRFDRQTWRVLARQAGGLALFCGITLLVASGLLKNLQISFGGILGAGLITIGLSLFGPFLAPMFTSGNFLPALAGAAIAMPVLLAGIAPFLLCRQPVRLGSAVLAWCGFITAFLFWLAVSIFTSAHYIG